VDKVWIFRTAKLWEIDLARDVSNKRIFRIFPELRGSEDPHLIHVCELLP